jgi:hypothetical protein
MFELGSSLKLVCRWGDERATALLSKRRRNRCNVLGIREIDSLNSADGRRAVETGRAYREVGSTLSVASPGVTRLDIRPSLRHFANL